MTKSKKTTKNSRERWFIYIIETLNNKLYTGITKDVEKRFHEHQNLKTGAKFLKANPPKKVVYTEKVFSKSKALKREIEIKKLSRSEKDQLISSS